MPRKSRAELEQEGVIADVTGGRDPLGHERPAPPKGMPKAQSDIWDAVVRSMRPRWFSPETHEQLSRYCYAMAECARLELELACLQISAPEYERISKLLAASAARALSYARALRITPVSNRENKNILDARDGARSLYPKPWDLGRAPRKLWERDPDDDSAPKKPWDL
jgi:hypothetical protein